MSGSHIESISWLKVPVDVVLSSMTLIFAFELAARGVFFDLSHGIPELSEYLKAFPVVLGVHLLIAIFFHLYRPRRAGSYGGLAVDLIKVNFQAALITMALSFYYREFSYSRLIVSYFFLLNPLVLFVHHVGWMQWTKHLASHGIGTRRCLIVGTGELAQAISDRIDHHPWTGLSVVGFVGLGDREDDSSPDEEISVDAGKVVGTIEELPSLVEERRIHEVVVAVPFRSMGALAEVDDQLARCSLGLQWVPDLEALNTLHPEVRSVEDMHLINLRATPMGGFSRFMKRSFDIVFSVALLVATGPLMAVTALLIRLTSGRGPILYRQDRVGLDGRTFSLLKFRTMVPDAEAESGPVWASEQDDRCTTLGRFLRRTSLDELPQLWNVLVGHMSLVGPRPERPHFIQQFRNTIPRYMLRHRMKAGLTGWAQVNGWRGNTSLPKRIQHDLYYLKNWTLWFDMKILLLTLFRGWGQRWNAY